MSRAAAAALLLTTGAAAAVAAVALHWPEPAHPGDPVCGAADRLVHAMDLSTLGDQAELRARAAELADALLSVDDDDEDWDGARTTGRQVADVLADPAATVDDLAAAIAPVTAQCRTTASARGE